MERSIIKTVVTFTISDKDSRNNIIDLLDNLGYVNGGDQSTMVNQKLCPKTTLGCINEYCKNNRHGLIKGDIVIIYFPNFKSNEGKNEPYISKNDFCYDPKQNAFV